MFYNFYGYLEKLLCQFSSTEVKTLRLKKPLRFVETFIDVRIKKLMKFHSETTRVILFHLFVPLFPLIIHILSTYQLFRRNTALKTI